LFFFHKKQKAPKRGLYGWAVAGYTGVNETDATMFTACLLGEGRGLLEEAVSTASFQ
jgi:hypothetical protein